MQIEQTKAEAISNKLAIEDMDVYRQMMEEKTHQLATLHQELTSWKASNYQVLYRFNLGCFCIYIPYSPKDTPPPPSQSTNVLLRYFLYLNTPPMQYV